MIAILPVCSVPALLLACAGLYGLFHRHCAKGSRMGVRMALGAMRGDVVR
jgi:hypothetical protein